MRALTQTSAPRSSTHKREPWTGWKREHPRLVRSVVDTDHIPDDIVGKFDNDPIRVALGNWRPQVAQHALLWCVVPINVLDDLNHT
jgi:hypothetical protein